MEPQTNCLFITYVEKEGPFLKVWGQIDKNTSLYIEQVLHTYSTQFDSGLAVLHPEALQTGVLCCAKYKDNKYYRARITSLDFLHNKYIEVNFVDYGHKDVVPVSNVRSLEGFETGFISIPPQAACFLLAEAVSPRGEWNDAYLDQICKEIRYSEVNFTVVSQVTKHYLVRLFIGVNDLALVLISKGLMRHTSLATQEAVLLAMMPRQAVAPPQSQQQNIATYKAFTLEPGSQYEVYVSYVTDGPCNFSVQLKQSEEVLGKLMKEINSMPLTPIEGVPIPGTVCLARCMEDAHICRAVVTNEVDGMFKVFYVDFGNFETVPLDSLYEIPFKYVIPKVMAIRFCLAGVEKSTVTLEMQCAFKQFVDNRLIYMKVLPMIARTSLPRCELWDPESRVSALEIVNQAAAVAYPEHISLTRGFSQPVRVSYVFSVKRFYVQVKARQDELTRLMVDIQRLCAGSDTFPGSKVKVGMPCYAFFEVDQQWYRSQIVEVLPEQVKVHYVDYGNEGVVSLSHLKPIEGRQLTVLRPQAIECCLNGYQNMGEDLERDNIFEELILEQEFTMKVVEMQGKRALIELIDAANYNVASLLLERLAAKGRAQVSPVLRQADNKIEHRKGHHSEGATRFDQRRQERNRNSFESNESNENATWKQNNKGFRNDRNKRDDLNDSTDSEKHSTKGYGNDRSKSDYNSRNNDGSSWRAKSHNKFEDRENRNTDWTNGNERKITKNNNKQEISVSDDVWDLPPSNDWAANNSSEEKKPFNKRDHWSKEGGDRGFKGRENKWEGRDGEKRSFKPREDRSRDNDSWNSRKGRENDSWGNKDDRRGRHNDSWGNKSGENDSWGNKERKGRDSWFEHDDRKSGENDSWGNDRKGRDGGWANDRKARDFKNKNRFEEKSNEWGGAGDAKAGFNKRANFKREKSELSSSGSETSFRKGNRSKPRSDFKKFDKSPTGGGDSWNVGSAVEVPNPAPSTAVFKTRQVDNTEADVTVSWFHNPGHFYVQIQTEQDAFKKLMGDIQQAYKGRPPGSSVAGAPVIGLFPEDNVLYRGRVIDIVGPQFKIHYVDFGNVSIVDKVWPIETRFMELPAQAICCKLSNIQEPSGGWADVSSYSSYFSKERFLCKFIATEDDRVAVNLECNNEDVGSLLVKDGLAVAVSMAPAVPPELHLLIGQQFRAMLVSVNSLADFSMSLQNGVLLNCAIFNLSESTETYEGNIKDKVGQILIVYVDDLTENRLEVTLYDSTGTKIKLIDRDEAAYETVDLICPYLIQYSTLTGEITHVDQETVYIQPAECAPLLEYYLNSAYEYYENTPIQNEITPIEGYAYAVKGSDTNWYRGRVSSITADKVTANYIDYGNSEEVGVDALRDLTSEFMEQPIACVPVTVKGADENLIGRVLTIAVTIGDCGVEGVVQEEQVQEPEVLVAPSVGVQECSEAVVAPPVGKVVMSHADSPCDFYLQLAESIEAIEQLQATLQEQIPVMPDMENPVIGSLCAAPYLLDQQWYRAQVLDADTDITTVRFVDYGNTDVLDNAKTTVKTLPPHLLALEVHATRCRLKIKPVEEEWSSEASQRFEQLCEAENLTVQFVSQDEKTNYVELYSDGVGVAEVLVKEGFATADEVATQTSSVGFVSHLNSPSEFWIQLENCVEELEWVAEQLSGSENFAELEDLAPGALCAALFPDDQMWYRARILSNTVAGIEVLFVDYGNSCTSVSLRELPEDLVMLPPLAQKCSLQKPDGLTNWGPEMVRKFSEISADGQTTFHVNKLSTGETAVVELLLDGVDVVTLLLPKTEDVTVKNVETMDEITLVKNGEELSEKFKLENLPEGVWSEDSVRRLKEICNDGESVLQAEFLPEGAIRLYRGLNDVRLDLSSKPATSATSPLKSRPPDRDNLHSEISGEMRCLIESLLDSIFGVESICVAECIVDNLITTVTNSSDNKPNESDQVRDMVEGLIESVEVRGYAAHLVDEIVDGSTNQHHVIANAVLTDVIEATLQNLGIDADDVSIAEGDVKDKVEGAPGDESQNVEGAPGEESQNIEGATVGAKLQSAEGAAGEDFRNVEGAACAELRSVEGATSENLEDKVEGATKPEAADVTEVKETSDITVSAETVTIESQQDLVSEKGSGDSRQEPSG